MELLTIRADLNKILSNKKKIMSHSLCAAFLREKNTKNLRKIIISMNFSSNKCLPGRRLRVVPS